MRHPFSSRNREQSDHYSTCNYSDNSFEVAFNKKIAKPNLVTRWLMNIKSAIARREREIICVFLRNKKRQRGNDFAEGISYSIKHFFLHRIYIKLVAAVLVVAIAVTMIFYGGEIEGATYTFAQNYWTGGATANSAQHPGNQNDWNEYQSKDASIAAESSVQLEKLSGSVVHTSDADFSPGIAQSQGALVSGTGSDASVTFDTMGVDDLEYATDIDAQNAFASSDTTTLQSYSENAEKVIGTNSLRLDSVSGSLGKTVTKRYFQDITSRSASNTLYQYGNHYSRSYTSGSSWFDNPMNVYIGDAFHIHIRGAIGAAGGQNPSYAQLQYVDQSGTRTTLFSVTGGNNYYISTYYDGYLTKKGSTLTFTGKIRTVNAYVTTWYEPNVDYTNSWTVSTQRGRLFYHLYAYGNGAANYNLITEGVYGSAPDLSHVSKLRLNVRSSRQGTNLRIGMKDLGGTTFSRDITIDNANVWEEKVYDISGIVASERDAIDEISFTVLNDDVDTTYYVDNIFAGTLGVYMSPIIDFAQKSNPQTLTYGTSLPVGTSLQMDVRGGNNATVDENWTDWTTGVANGGSVAALHGVRYFQYRASMQTDRNANPILNYVTLDYEYYPSSKLSYISDSYVAGFNFESVSQMTAPSGNAMLTNISLPDGANIGSRQLMGLGSAASDQIFGIKIIPKTDGKYRMYYSQYNGSYYRILYRDTIDTNLPNAANLSSAQVILGISTSNQAISPEIVRLSNGVYRIYYGYNNGSYFQVAYRDMTDTNLPDASNMDSQQLLGIGTSSTNYAMYPFVKRLTDGKYRLYYSLYNSTYAQLAYRDTADTNYPTSANMGAQQLLGIGSASSNQGANPKVLMLSNGSYRLYYSYYNGTFWQLAYRDTTDTSIPSPANLGAQQLLSTGSAANDSAYGPEIMQLSDGKYRIYYSYGNGTYYQLVYKDTVSWSFVSAGSFISNILDSGQNSIFSTLNYVSTEPASTTLSLDLRAGNTITPDESWTDWISGISDGEDISALSDNRFIQYRANMETSDSTTTPVLNSVSLNYLPLRTIISSPYDTSDAVNVLAKTKWSESLPAGTDIGLQVRTSADGFTWTSWMGPDGTNRTFFTDPEGGETIPAVFSDGVDDRWMQYRAFLSSDGANTPILSSTSLIYVVNASPEIQNITALQESDGLVTVDYEVRDPDTMTGASQSEVNIGLQYCTANCDSVGSETWADAVSLAGDYGNGVAVDEASWTTHQVRWNAKTDYVDKYFSNLKIRVKVDDGEGANNVVYGGAAVETLDTTNPELGTVPVLIDASVVPAKLHLVASDDSAMQMKISLNSDLSGANWENFSDTKDITLSTNPDVVYVQIKDAYNNTSSILSAVTPETPTKMMVQDTSNVLITPTEPRLFIAWKTVVSPSSGFDSYEVYRSDNQTNWDLIDTITDRTRNYYGDNSVTESQNYYYRVITKDVDGNKSYSSAIVNGKANGIQDAGEGGGGVGEQPPIISNVSISNISSASAIVTWDTDRLSNSAVAYIVTNDGNFADAPIKGVATMADSSSGVGQHRISLNNLSPNTTYYIKLHSTDVGAMTGVSDNGGVGYSFTTLNGPAVSNVQVDSGNKEAVISWDTNIASTCKISYSKNVYNGQLANPVEIGSDESRTNHSQKISDLDAGETYYFSITTIDENGASIIDNNNGSLYSFVADDGTSPVISDLQQIIVSSAQAAIHWSTDEQATTQIKYSVEQGGPYATLNEDTAKDINHYAIIDGLSAGTKYYYKAISKDISGNETVSPEKYFITSLDPALNHEPLSEISDISPAVITDTKAVLSFKTDQSAQCFVEYGNQSENYTEVPVGEAGYESEHSIHVGGLIYSTDYYYKITCQDNLDTIISSEEKAFTTLEKQVGESQVEQIDRVAPSISNARVTNIGNENATIEWETDEDSNSLVRFGTSNIFGRMVGKDGTNSDAANYVKNHKVDLERLVPGTKYYYAALSIDRNGNMSQSSQGTFTTEGTSNISSVIVESAEIGKATVVWTTEVPTTTVLEYGVSTKYGSIYEDNNISKTHQVSLSNLKAGSAYHFLIKGEDESGNVYVSADTTFEPKSPPKIKDIQALHITEHSAIIEFTTNVPTSASVTFQDSRKDNEAQTKGHPDFSTKHKIEISDLVSGLVYLYTVSARDENGTEVTSEQKSFTTGKDTKEPLIDQVKTDTALTQNERVQAIISWKTDEPAMTYLIYKKGKDGEEKEVPVSEILAQQHVSVITAFEQGTVYYYKVKAIDASDNEAVSNEFALLTPRRKENIVQIIVTNFYDIFRWAKR